ncbi:hypothetical protein [Streptomyces sp. NPDC002187]|uniref:hypothetical protein n=1 Tax=Streptomyces sp. NPDC002187 TaxID=3364637 RepID=UPI0036AC1912
MFSAAAEASYLSGWMAFDNAEHDIAEPHFTLGPKPTKRALCGLDAAPPVSAVDSGGRRSRSMATQEGVCLPDRRKQGTRQLPPAPPRRTPAVLGKACGSNL